MKKLAVMGLLCAALSLSFGAQATVLTFDDARQDFGGEIPDGYGGLNWDNMYVVNGPAVEPQSGYVNGLMSGDYVALNAWGTTASVTDGVFDFNGAYLTAAWNDGLSVHVEGYQGANLIYDQTVVVNTDEPTWFAFNYLDIDRLVFSSFGGTANPNFDSTGEHFAMDNFTFNEPVVPEPASMVLFGIGLGGLAVRRFRRK